MGGEPLCEENQFLVSLIIDNVKKKLPDTEIYVWTGYTYDQLLKHPSPLLKGILNKIDCIIDGPYIESKRDITLSMRGSSNQNIIYLDKE